MTSPERSQNSDANGSEMPSRGLRELVRSYLDRDWRRDETMQYEASVPKECGDSLSPLAGSESLRELARLALHGAILASERASDSDGPVRVLLRRACDFARAREIQVEKLLILIKESWHELPESRRRSHSDSQVMLARVVSLCIEEYYTRQNGFDGTS